MVVSHTPLIPMSIHKYKQGGLCTICKKKVETNTGATEMYSRHGIMVLL